MNILAPLVIFMLCYILGSFPTAYIVGRLNNVNIFEIGSGNMGANNVTRAIGIKWGALVWAVDAGKGILAVLLARLLAQTVVPYDSIVASVIGAIAVVVGHNWSLLATLITGTVRGGKGAATASGTWLIMIAPYFAYVVIATALVWGLVVLLTRYVSLGVLVAVAVGSIWVLYLIGQGTSSIPHDYMYYIVPVAIMIYIRHWKNILSLLTGRERRLGDPASS